METVDDEIRDKALTFLDKAKADGKPFFLWLNPTRMHIVTHLSPKYEAMRNSRTTGPSMKPAWRSSTTTSHRDEEAQGHGRGRQQIVVFTTDNGTEVFTWPDGGQTPFAQAKGR